jgi:RNA polymerase-binding transcription factor DksA
MERFKKLLDDLKEEIETEISRFEKNTLHKNMKESTGEISNHTTHPADMSADIDEYEKAYMLASQEGKILVLILQAMERIEDGTFGACIECGDPISQERLKAIPYSPYCVKCQEELEREVR